MQKLIKEYKKALKDARTMRGKADKDTGDKKVISGIVSSLEYSLEWMETGRRPGDLKGVGKQDVYGVNGYWDESMNSFVSVTNYKDPFEEIEEKIDRELEVKGYAKTS